MAVNDRKMFRRRDARNQLRQMGGIMSSSPELMQTVQRFNQGGRVDLSQPARNIAVPPKMIQDFLGVNETEQNPVSTAIPPFLARPSSQTLRGPTAENIQSPEFQGSARMSDLLSESIVPTTMDGFNKVGEYSLSEQPSSFGPDDLRVTPPKKSSPPPPPPPQITQTSALIEPITVGKEMQAYAEQLMNSGADQTEINDKILEMIGEKEEGKQISVEERYEKNRALYEKVLGADPEQDRKIDGYNLAMMGFMIAAGDSPNALTNIARGAARGAERMQMTAEKRQERARRIKELGLTQAIQDDRTALQFERENERWRKGELMSWLKSRTESAEADRRLGIQIASQVAQLQTKINTDVMIANKKTIDDDRRAAAERDANRELLILKGLQDPNIGSMATSQLLSEGIEINDPEFSTQLIDRVRTLVQDPEVVAALRVGSSTGLRDYEAMPRREEYVLKNTADALKDFTILDTIARELGVDPNNLKSEDIRRFYGNMYDQEAALRSQPTQRIQLEP
jgi:cob(I)alamin adenosyltransferase